MRHGRVLTIGQRGKTDMMLTGWGILILAICVIAAIWIVVLWGSRYFGPQ